jgi:hypothetical protein
MRRTARLPAINPPVALLAAVLSASACVACFESPVQQTLGIDFQPDGEARIEVLTRIARVGNNPVAAERIDAVSEEILRGDDVWSRGIREMDPSIERREYEYHDGKLAEAAQRAVVPDPGLLTKLFSSVPAGAYVSRENSEMLLELIPTGSNRASDRQERTVRESLDGFSKSLADYLRAVAELYRHLDKEPGRARPCFEEIFESLVPADSRRQEELTSEEVDLIDPISDGMSETAKILALEEGQAFTLEELSRLVFDPFPAAIQIRISGTVEESVGFAPAEEGWFSIPVISFWSALTSLGDEWIEPNPVIDFVSAARRGGDDPFDLDSFVSRPRAVHEVPDAAKIRESVASRLRPADLYRLRWRLPSSETDRKKPVGSDVMAGALKENRRRDGR